jgi:hypothetical protein
MPHHQFLHPLPDEKFHEISAKHDGERIETKFAFVIALEAQDRAAGPVPSSDDAQPFSVLMLQAGSKRLASSSHHVQLSFNFRPLPSSRKFALGAESDHSRTQFID